MLALPRRVEGAHTDGMRAMLIPHLGTASLVMPESTKHCLRLDSFLRSNGGMYWEARIAEDSLASS